MSPVTPVTRLRAYNDIMAVTNTQSDHGSIKDATTLAPSVSQIGLMESPRENCPCLKYLLYRSIHEVTLDKGSTIETGSNVQRFWQNKSEEKNDATKVEAGPQLLLMKVYSSVTRIAADAPTGIRCTDAMTLEGRTGSLDETSKH